MPDVLRVIVGALLILVAIACLYSIIKYEIGVNPKKRSE